MKAEDSTITESCHGIECYDLRSLFQSLPPNVTKCPHCRGDLIDRLTDQPSTGGAAFRETGLIPVVETRLLTCEHCHWWLIREIREDLGGTGFAQDEVVMFTPPVDQLAHSSLTLAPDIQMSWRSVLDDPRFWRSPRPMPRSVAAWLWHSDSLEGIIDTCPD